MIGLDTSSLLPLAMRAHPLHEATRREIEQADDTFAVAPLVLAEFVHCSTDPKRFAEPLTCVQALDWTDALLDLPHVQMIVPDQAALRLWLRWMREFRLGRKRTLDTQLAATLHLAGVKHLLTANPSDFRIFSVFELIVPQLSGSEENQTQP